MNIAIIVEMMSSLSMVFVLRSVLKVTILINTTSVRNAMHLALLVKSKLIIAFHAEKKHFQTANLIYQQISV